MRSRTLAAVVSTALAATLALPAATAAAATPSTDGIVFSEYVEGSSHQKAVELYNGTGAPVSLAGLQFRLYSNATSNLNWPTATYDLPAVELADGDVFVVTHPRFNDDEGLTVGGDVDATSSAINFNGDDAFLLLDTATGQVVDSFKQPGARIDDAGDVTLRRTDFTRDTNPTDAEDLDAQYAPEARGASDDVSQLGLAPGATDGGGDPEPEPVCTTAADDLTLLSEVQGPGDFSPLHGDEVTVRAVVTLSAPTLDGYFLQEEPADTDGDPATSEAVFVYDPRGGLPETGATIELTDKVTSYRDLTQFSFPRIEVCDVPPVTIPATPLTLPLDDTGRESLEAMVVTTTQDLQVTRLFTAYRYGELGLALDGPLLQPTAVHAPDATAALDLAASNSAHELLVNDRDEAWSQFSPFPWELFDEDLSAGDTMRAGAVTGPLNHSFGAFKVEPIGRFPETVDTDAIQPVPTLADGNDVAAFNVLNYFNTFGDSAVLRGATNAEDFALQTEKVVAAILEMDAAVVGLVELENDYEDHYDDDPATVPSIQTLVDALNEQAGAGAYDWVVPGEDQLTDEGLGGGGLGTDAIAVGFVYQPGRATEIGTPATFDIDAELTGDSENNRWPLAQTFDIDGETITLVVNHFKSKGSSCTDTAGPGFELGDDVRTDLTGNCNLVREYAARRVLDWVRTKPTGATTPDTLVIGDLNAYDEEGPIHVFEDAGWTDIIERDGDDAFTYKFDGRFGRLDHVLASPSAKRLVTDAAVWQVNSRAPYGYLYDNSPQDDYPAYWASSDHDPVLVSLDAPGRGRGR